MSQELDPLAPPGPRSAANNSAKLLATGYTPGSHCPLHLIDYRSDLWITNLRVAVPLARHPEMLHLVTQPGVHTLHKDGATWLAVRSSEPVANLATYLDAPVEPLAPCVAWGRQVAIIEPGIGPMGLYTDIRGNGFPVRSDLLDWALLGGKPGSHAVHGSETSTAGGVAVRYTRWTDTAGAVVAVIVCSTRPTLAVAA